MDRKAFLKLFEEFGVFREGHFVYNSGKHGNMYINKDAIYPHTRIVSRLCKHIAEHFADEKIDVVAAPSIGGVVLSQWVTHHLHKLTEREVLSTFTEVEGGKTIFKRGYDKLIPHRRVLVVEDILTTGNSAKSVIDAVRELEGHVVGLGVLCNRGEVTPSKLSDVPELFCLVDLDLTMWDKDECPLCKEGVKVNTEVGKGAQFLAAQES